MFSELDDFGDTKGEMLRASAFCVRCKGKFEEHSKLMAQKYNNNKSGSGLSFWGGVSSIFGGRSDHAEDGADEDGDVAGGSGIRGGGINLNSATVSNG